MIWPLLLLQSVPVFPPPSAPPRTVAVRTPAPLVVDGKLDEAAWQSARDFRFDQNDAVAVVFDPFDDQRTGFIFQVTPAGNQRDAQFLVGQGLDQD